MSDGIVELRSPDRDGPHSTALIAEDDTSAIPNDMHRKNLTAAWFDIAASAMIQHAASPALGTAQIIYGPNDEPPRARCW